MFIVPLICEFITLLSGKILNVKVFFQWQLLHQAFDHLCENVGDLVENSQVLLETSQSWRNISELEKLEIWIE